jgi:hypothetical protein
LKENCWGKYQTPEKKKRKTRQWGGGEKHTEQMRPSFVFCFFRFFLKIKKKLVTEFSGDKRATSLSEND